jgi:hypothetical protein
MRLPSFFALCGCLVLLAGCASNDFPDRVRARFAEVPPKVEIVAADARTAYFAAQMAFKRLDYTLVRSSVATLSVEAASRINTSVAFRDSVQLRAVVTLREAGPGRTEVALELFELREGQGLGGASEVPRAEHGFQATYFAALQQVLNEGAAGDPAAGK